MDIIAGPCVLDGVEVAAEIAVHCRDVCKRLGVDYYFKASFDKANRTSLSSYRGPGLVRGIRQLERVKNVCNVKILTDVHLPHQAAVVGAIADVVQVPAFLCRQTDLLKAVARHCRIVNIKKGQFIAPDDIVHAVEKVLGCEGRVTRRVWVTERGACFGYNNLVVDFRGISRLRALGYHVIFDATHSVQRPGGASTGGERHFIQDLACAAAAVGVDGIFMEVHPDPDIAKCDGENSLKLDDFEGLVDGLIRIEKAVPGRFKPNHTGFNKIKG